MPVQWPVFQDNLDKLEPGRLNRSRF